MTVRRLGERAHERHFFFGIEPRLGPCVNAVGLRVCAAADVVARRHAHDLRKHLVRVKKRSVRRARDPNSNGQIICNGADDRVFHSQRSTNHHALPLRSTVWFWYAQREMVDDVLLARERERIFSRVWWCAGRVSDVEQPGSYLRTRDEVIVVRGEDLVLRAFYNLCRHRGTPLLDGDAPQFFRGRVTRSIVCPYHGWTYACSGALRAAPHASDLDHTKLGLRTVRVAEWQGFVFVATDESLPPLDAWMGEAPPWLVKAPLALANRARRVVHEVEANWKLLVSNFQESQHFPSVHPDLERLTPTSRARSFFPIRSKWLGGEMDIADDAETVSKSKTLGGRALISDARVVYDAMLFPAMLTSLQPDYFLTYQLDALSPTRTRIASEIFVHPSTRVDDLSDVFEFWDLVNAQDRAICERQQRGVTARGFSPSNVHIAADEGVYAFERMIAEAMK